MIKIGLAAFGMSGQVFHAPLITDTEGLLLKGAVQRPGKDRKVSLHDHYPEAQAYESYALLLADPDIDVVVVNTPQELHYEQALLALEAGKHVVVEKPATLTYQQITHLYEVVDRVGRSVIVFQNRRWDADFLTLKQVVSSGVLGHVVQYESTFNRWRNYLEVGSWKEVPNEGSGLLYNLGSHLIDQVVHLFGAPATVFGIVKAERKGSQVVDAFQVVLQYADGLTANLRSSYLVAEPVPKFAVHGDLGSFVKYGLDVQEGHLKAGLVPSTQPNWGHEEEANWATLYTEKSVSPVRVAIPSIAGSYQSFYQGLRDHLADGAPAPVDAFAPAMTIKIIEAVMESSATGRVVWV
jgi:predicted dehydrogenase